MDGDGDNDLQLKRYIEVSSFKKIQELSKVITSMDIQREQELRDVERLDPIDKFPAN